MDNAQHPQETAILRKYAGGAELAAIAQELNISRDDVAQVVSAANYQRGRAAELVREREAKRPPVVDITPRYGIEALLTRAETIPRLHARATRIRELLEALEADLENAANVAQAEQRVAQARAALERATSELRGLTRPAAQGGPAQRRAPAPAAVDDAKPKDRDVRTWAARAGVDCPKGGRVPRKIVEQYLAAKIAA